MRTLQNITLGGNSFNTTNFDIDFIYPVGSYYETSDSTFDPNTTWGGTWELETAGQVHVSAGTGYAVAGALSNTTDGGEETVKLTDAEMAHGHGFTQPTVSGGGHKHSLNQRNAGTTGTRATDNVTYGASGHDYTTQNAFTSSDGTHTHTVSGGAVANLSGASSTRTAHNNMQPYIVVNRWHRTA